MGKPIYIIVDAHVSGLGAILSQGNKLADAKPIAIASRTTNEAEKRYPQIDLEATALDFGLRRFRKYIVGAPHPIIIVTDHKPLCAIFNGRRHGSIRTDRIKLRHQDIRFQVQYQPGKQNQTDFLSRRAKPLEIIPKEEQEEANDLNNLLYTLHITPIMDTVGLSKISLETEKDIVLK